MPKRTSTPRRETCPEHLLQASQVGTVVAQSSFEFDQRAGRRQGLDRGRTCLSCPSLSYDASERSSERAHILVSEGDAARARQASTAPHQPRLLGRVPKVPGEDDGEPICDQE